MRSEKMNKSEASRGLNAIDRSAKALTYLIEDILDISRIVSGKMRLDLQPVRLVSLIGSAVDLMSSTAAVKDIQIRTSLDEKTGLVSGDQERLAQVMTNLLSNSIKFTPHRGRIEVRLECSDAEARITVTDTGMGIAADRCRSFSIASGNPMAPAQKSTRASPGVVDRQEGGRVAWRRYACRK